MAGFAKKKDREFPEVVPVLEVLQDGDIFTKLSFLIWGVGNLARKQIIQGILFLALESSSNSETF